MSSQSVVGLVLPVRFIEQILEILAVNDLKDEFLSPIVGHRGHALRDEGGNPSKAPFQRQAQRLLNTLLPALLPNLFEPPHEVRVFPKIDMRGNRHILSPPCWLRFPNPSIRMLAEVDKRSEGKPETLRCGSSRLA